jgi:hypothetical protein
VATNLENLQTAKAGLLAKLADLATTSAHKPNYSVDGQSVSWGEYHAMLTKQVEAINTLIQNEQPFIVVSRGRA